jgi:hypothetical protein
VNDDGLPIPPIRDQRLPSCAGKLRSIADVTDPEVIQRILEHVHSARRQARVRSEASRRYAANPLIRQPSASKRQPFDTVPSSRSD